MIGTTVTHYRILEKLGGGGMGVVYRGEDTRLGRPVALKFLPEDAAKDPQALGRFRIEARSASALNHPHICTVYDIDEYQGQPFLVMEFLEGQTLRQRLGGTPLEPPEIIETAVQIADALDAAHSRGIIHRDIKPANIYLTSRGQAKVLDFGVAKLIRAGERTTTGTGAVAEQTAPYQEPALTNPGAAVGTAAYMSPEQARGEPLDPRSDLFSFGVLLYELATGVNPFQGGTPALTFDAILNRWPAPAATLNARIPGELSHIIDRCLQKRREDRYPSARELLAELRRLKRQLDSGQIPTSAETTRITATPLVAESSARSIAVLPFVNMSGNPDNEYFGDGLAEELINLLIKVAGLRVASRTSAFAFKSRQQDIRDIGRQLNVSTVLEGSVRRAGNRLRVVAQLVDVANGYHLWSERYDRTLEDVFAIQDEIAQSIADALQLMLTEREKKALAHKPTTNVQAYDCYLRGRQFMHQFRRRSLEFALEMFTRAIQIDPHFALAYAGKADCRSILCMMWERSEATLQQADEDSLKALELGPDLAESHVARGFALFQAGRYDEARLEFETAIQQNPQLFEAYFYYGRVCQRQGMLVEAERLLRKAAEVQPDDYQSLLLLANVYQGLNQPDEIETVSRLGLERAERYIALHPDDARPLALGASNWCLLGQSGRALEWAGRAMALDPQEPLTLYNVGCVYSLLGRPDEALDCLEKATRFGYFNKDWIRRDSDLSALHGHPRFESLVKAE